jgi:acetaldehyde dehydrogenase/alcohol dehydrogenase
MESLRQVNCRNVVIVTDDNNEQRGAADSVRQHLDQAAVHVFSDILPEPDEAIVRAGVEVLERVRPDLIVAVGGGSVLDAAKAMRLFYENPQLTLRELALPFLDPRKRVASTRKMNIV